MFAKLIETVASWFRWYHCETHGWYHDTGDCALCVWQALK